MNTDRYSLVQKAEITGPRAIVVVETFELANPRVCEPHLAELIFCHESKQDATQARTVRQDAIQFLLRDTPLFEESHRLSPFLRGFSPSVLTNTRK